MEACMRLPLMCFDLDVLYTGYQPRARGCVSAFPDVRRYGAQRIERMVDMKCRQWAAGLPWRFGAIEGLIIWLAWAMRRWLAASRTSIARSYFSDAEKSFLYVDEAVQATLELAQYEFFVLHSSSLWIPVDFISLALCGLDCEEGAEALGHRDYGRQEKVTDLAIVLLLRLGLAVFLVFGTQRDIWRLWIDASRSLTSPVRSYSHSRCSSQTHSQPSTPRSSPLRAFGLGFHVSPRSMRGKRWPRAGAGAGPYPFSTSQQHLSLYQLNCSEGAASRSFVASPNTSQTFGPMQPMGALRTSQGRQLSLSLSQFNYSRSFAQTVSYAASSPEDPVPPMPLPLPQPQAQTQTQPQGPIRDSATGPSGIRISLPLPAVISRTSKDGFDEYFTAWRDGVSLPSIVVQESTPDLARDGEGPWGVRSPDSPVTPTLLTPTSEGEIVEWAPPVPPKDVGLLRPAGLGLGVAGTSPSSGEERRPDSPVLGVEHSSHARADMCEGGEGDEEGELEEVELGELRALGEDREEASTVASRYSCSTWAHPYLPQYPPSSSQDGAHSPSPKR
ncbi:hypothetical protein EIP86_009183 [Pleurotus ostreatoroseus]|nr:hypothetical protein EIP86_009183 [Pleurotus ostreatoroseus]